MLGKCVVPLLNALVFAIVIIVSIVLYSKEPALKTLDAIPGSQVASTDRSVLGCGGYGVMNVAWNGCISLDFHGYIMKADAVPAGFDYITIQAFNESLNNLVDSPTQVNLTTLNCTDPGQFPTAINASYVNRLRWNLRYYYQSDSPNRVSVTTSTYFDNDLEVSSNDWNGVHTANSPQGIDSVIIKMYKGGVRTSFRVQPVRAAGSSLLNTPFLDVTGDVPFTLTDSFTCLTTTEESNIGRFSRVSVVPSLVGAFVCIFLPFIDVFQSRKTVS